MYNFYIQQNKQTIFYLHCWGARESGVLGISKLKNELSKDFEVFLPFLPGNGNTKPPKELWRIVSYVDYVKKLLDDSNIKNVMIIGHSFGGGVALKLAEIYPDYVSKLFIVEPVLGNNYSRGKILDLLFNTSIHIYKAVLKSRLPNIAMKILISLVSGKDIKSILSKDVVDYQISLDSSTNRYSIDYSSIKCPVYFFWSNSVFSKTPRLNAENIVKQNNNFHMNIYKGNHLTLTTNPQKIVPQIRGLI